jgi:CheY-like chemotaxis protein/HPt (histidine-containing phosphotransfer) domain-containing protein
VVEDNYVNLQVAMQMLENRGYRVDAASSGREAVEAVERLPYDLVFMDCQMPVMDGYEATAEIRRGERDGSRHVPIIALTANAMRGDAERCFAAGMDDYIAKPVTGEALAAVLARWEEKIGLTRGEAPEPTVTSAPDRREEDSIAAALESLAHELGPEMLRVVVAAFVAETEARLQALRDAVVDGDADKLYREGHTLKGNSANLGATCMAELALQVETRGREGRVADAEATVVALETEFERVRGQYEAVMAEPASS